MNNPSHPISLSLRLRLCLCLCLRLCLCLSLQTGEDAIDAPTLVSAASHLDVGVVAAGRAHTAAITRDGVAHTWGCRKTGKLGWRSNLDETNVTDAVHDKLIRRVSLPPSPTFAAAATLADDHTLVLDGDSGGVLAFGENKEGQLGIGSSFQELAPGMWLSRASVAPAS